MLKGGRDYSMRSYASRDWVALKDKRAVEPVVALIAEGVETYQAVEVLAKIGSEAEDAALTLLKEKHLDTRRQGCNILGRIGTKKSLEPLRELMLDTDYSLSSSAAEAVRSIQTRLQLSSQ
jgi:HEAT repeat protein